MMTDRSKWLYPRTVKGRDYLYFRPPSGKLTKLPLDQTSTEFARAYDAAMRAMKAPPPSPSPGRAMSVKYPPTSDSLHAAIAVYRDSVAFDKLRPGTKVQYEHTLRQLDNTLGPGKLADLDTDAVDIHTERMTKKRGASVGDRHVRVLSKIWKVCRKYPQFKIKGLPNPTVDAEKRYVTKLKHRPWTADVQKKFMAQAPDNLKLAKLLLHFSGQRGGDAVKIKWSDFDGRGLYVRPEKTHGDAAAQANYHLCPKPLLDALNAAPRVAETILVNGRGEPYRVSNVLSAAIRRTLTRIGAVKPGERSFVMHGLRKNAASEVAQLGVGALGIKSVTGHKSDREANEYAAFADKLRVNELVVDLWNAELSGEADVARRRAKIRRVK